MFYGNKAKINSSDLPEFYINDQLINRTNTYTYLGIKLDEQLSLDTHANLLIKRVSDKIYQLTKIRSFITQKAALLIYKNMILPILEYGDVFIHSASKGIRKKLTVLQNKALRCALSKEKLYPTNDLHMKARLLKLKDRRHMHVLLHMFQLAQMPNFKLWKMHQANGVRTRSSKKKLITSRRPSNEKYKRSITYQGPKLWNSLPSQVQKLDSYYEFKGSIRKLFQPLQNQNQNQNQNQDPSGATTMTANKKNRNRNRNKNKTKANQNQNQNQSQSQTKPNQTKTQIKTKNKTKNKTKPKPKPKTKTKTKTKTKPKPKPNQTKSEVKVELKGIVDRLQHIHIHIHTHLISHHLHSIPSPIFPSSNLVLLPFYLL